MLLTMAYEPTSGFFKLNNGTELKINCDKSNWLDLVLCSIFGVSEHMNEIDNAGF
jgi:hypothetical protein